MTDRLIYIGITWPGLAKANVINVAKIVPNFDLKIFSNCCILNCLAEKITMTPQSFTLADWTLPNPRLTL